MSIAFWFVDATMHMYHSRNSTIFWPSYVKTVIKPEHMMLRQMILPPVIRFQTRLGIYCGSWDVGLLCAGANTQIQESVGCRNGISVTKSVCYFPPTLQTLGRTIRD
ncbi:hypothetical protein O6H91_22G038400 [Diphasiastrum complanatum]|uniref:Uncharacterized protein n=2 Tax=Diphasiastrum complanatum TaxID=34168 RepID=A0ACC2AEV9_DIPCM|nr:hypothetical protein O6H91_22G037500 [Diphasiastrum complanatum]KAJ7516007.1 hypothetical protein O6H91_22G038400 [Diphasiastrum complanatum]